MVAMDSLAPTRSALGPAACGSIPFAFSQKAQVLRLVRRMTLGSKMKRDGDDGTKSFLGGILVPALGAAYAIGIIVRRRGYWSYVHAPSGAEAIKWAIGLLGFSLIFHAIYFTPYRGHPILRSLLIGGGAALLAYGFFGQVG